MPLSWSGCFRGVAFCLLQHDLLRAIGFIDQKDRTKLSLGLTRSACLSALTNGEGDTFVKLVAT